MWRTACAATAASVLLWPVVATAAPRLVVLIAVDQLRRDRLDAELPGGLGRLVREGRVFADAMLDHAGSETCPGHASMLSGRHPGVMGIPANTYIDLVTGERRYCVEDHAPDAAVLGGGDAPEDGRSPRSLRADTLGDWLAQARPGSRVFAVSAKDRSAVTLGGRHPDGVYWLLRGEQPGFTTSRYYASSLPDWVEGWNAGLVSRVPERWTYAAGPGPGGRPDDQPGESDERRRTSPHPLQASDPEDFADSLYRSPFVDDVTLDFARVLVEAEALGSDDAPDLLAVSLSGTDTVGHLYGPFSLEARDALERLDRSLGDFLAFLEARSDGRLLVVLTADHGVLPLPEWLAETGALTCPVPGGRQGLVGLVLGLYWELYWELSPWAWPGPWVNVASQVSIDRERAARHEVPVEHAVAVAERWLEAQPAIREAWTRREIAEGEGPFARLYRNSYDAARGERSGDLAIQVEPTCLLDFEGSGTTHGSPYDYDRAVPLVLFGAGVPPGIVHGPAATVDIAPTLAGQLGLTAPAGLDGRDLLAR